jgi:putative FmdB family regulatory protein
MPIHQYQCPCGNLFDEFFKMKSDVPATIQCPKCKGVAQKQFSAPHTEKDFSTPIRSISRPINSRADAERLLKNCPDVEIEEDAEEDGSHKALIPVCRNFAARRQLYQYLHLQDSR